MKIGINLNINVSKIDKSKLYDGKNGKYLSMTCFIDTEQKDDYGNHGRIDEGQSKEERQQGVKPAILGNARIFWTDGAAPAADGAQNGSQAAGQAQQDVLYDDTLPF
jgi:hypothetical protein